MDYERELQRFKPVIRTLGNITLLGKKVVLKGEENFVKSGPNIILGNHAGSFKDIAVLFKIVPRPIIFTANQEIFDKDKLNHLIRHYLKHNIRTLGILLDFLLRPVKIPIVYYISNNISKIGTIPVDLYSKKRTAIGKCEENLRKGRAIVLLQGGGMVKKNTTNPFISTFKRGPSIICYNLYKRDGITVPVTPVAIYGTQKPFLTPGKVKVNVGKPMKILDYIEGGFNQTVDRFKTALEAQVKSLLIEMIRS
ncbi:MAG: lysophospholipid acyltransferase family protein [Candidatus Aminicenantes bacterium]